MKIFIKILLPWMKKKKLLLFSKLHFLSGEREGEGGREGKGEGGGKRKRERGNKKGRKRVGERRREGKQKRDRVREAEREAPSNLFIF